MNLSLLGNLRKALLALTVACFVAGVAIAPACDRAALENYRHDPTDRFAEMQWPDRGLGGDAAGSRIELWSDIQRQSAVVQRGCW